MRVERDDLDACDPHLKFNILAVCRLRVQIQKNSKGFTLKFALVHFFKGGQTASELAKASELLQHATDLRPVKDKPFLYGPTFICKCCMKPLNTTWQHAEGGMPKFVRIFPSWISLVRGR